MIKAKEFLDYLCNDLNYRFFSGVPTLGLKSIFSSMNSEFMHYIPAANESIAIKIATGVRFYGPNSVVILDAKNLCCTDLDFNISMRIPILVLASFSERYNRVDERVRNVLLSASYKEDLYQLVRHMESSATPAVLYFEEGTII